ncbi:MAG TPA: hypothetical protein VFX35_05860 [Solirubrobacterales bacterium]|nr:hypothetical protein [Solirubrobacterales bacterium]
MSGSLRRIAAIGMGIAALAFAGCGGSSEETLTKAQFVEQANKICRAGENKRAKRVNELLEEQASKKPSAKPKDDIIFDVIAIYEETTGELSELGKPEGEEEKVDAIVEAMEEAADRVHANPQSALTGDLPFRKANKLAEDYGLDSCDT